MTLELIKKIISLFPLKRAKAKPTAVIARHYWYLTLMKRCKDNGDQIYAWWMAESESPYPPLQKICHDYCDRYGCRPIIIECIEISKEDYDDRAKYIKK